jgi:hypothetical protein
MNRLFTRKGICMIGLALFTTTCKKEQKPNFTPKIVTYEVTGTHFRLNFIDSLHGFKENQLHNNSFIYEFRKAPGANIGFSIFKQAATDTIFAWRLSINHKLYANGFSEGGAWMTIPY